MIRLSRLYQFLCIDEPLVKVYSTRGSLFEDEKALEIALGRILEKCYSAPDEAEALSICLRGFGSRMVSYGSVREGRAYLAKSFKVYPNIRSFLALCLSLSGSYGFRNITDICGKILSFLRRRHVNFDSPCDS